MYWCELKIAVYSLETYISELHIGGYMAKLAKVISLPFSVSNKDSYNNHTRYQLEVR